MESMPRTSVFRKLKWRWPLAVLQLLVVVLLYFQAAHRFNDSQIEAYQAANPGARVDLGGTVRSSPLLITRFAYAENFPAILVAVRLSNLVRLAPLRLGRSYTLDFNDIWYGICVFILWYFMGLWLERKLLSEGRLPKPRRWTLALNVLGLACSAVFTVSLLGRVAHEGLIIKGQEVEIAGLAWALFFLVYFLVALKPCFPRQLGENKV